LDVGAGTGRAVKLLRETLPQSRVLGVEPVSELRLQGHANGLSTDALVEGDALNLSFRDEEFDWVIETGVLHHIRDFRKAVREMCRVARVGVMISDANNIGQGSATARAIKYAVKSIGLWPAVNFVQTRGKNYKYSEGDGVFYSFCVFDCIDIVRKKFPTIHFMNTETSSPSLYRTAGQVMLLAHR